MDWLRKLPQINWQLARTDPKAGVLRAGDLLCSWLAHDLIHIRQINTLHYEYHASTSPEFSTGIWRQLVNMSSRKAPSGVAATAREIFPKLGLSQKAANPGAFWGEWGGRGPILKKYTPIDGTLLASVREASPSDYERVVKAAQAAFQVLEGTAGAKARGCGAAVWQRASRI